MTAGSVSVPIIIPLRPPVLGIPKSFIDTTTRIEIKTGTVGAKIYYTTNGLKPEPFQNFGPEAKATLLYSHPFLLPAGKKTIKAVAISENNQESYVVTKVFDVEYVPLPPEHNNVDNLEFLNELPSNNDAKQKVKKFANKLMTSKEAWQDMNHEQKGREENIPHNDISRSSNHLTMKNFDYSIAPHITDSSQFLRLQRETDYLRCPHCLAPRPSADPFARFCNECGNPVTPLTHNKLPPPQVNQIGKCFTCESIVPFNTNHCLVCEAPLKPQNISRADIHLPELTPCVACGTANQSNVGFCISCGSSLPEKRYASVGHSLVKNFDASLVKMCQKCGRKNNSNARFCDWCRTKPIQCIKCCSTNQPHAQYCTNCGTPLQPQSNELKIKEENNLTSYLAPTVKTSDVGTQTVGLFYPSQPKFKHQEILNGIIKSRLKDENNGNWTDRKPILISALSPGRGYWRKQIEHICAHLKAHTSNDITFRALISQPRMGKLLQATLNEDGYELSLTLNFALRSPDTIVNSNNFKLSSSPNYEEQEEEDITARKAFLNPYTKGTKVNSKENDLVNERNKRLLKEVGKTGKGRPERVVELIEEGANPLSCVTKDGLSILHIAAINKHADVIPVLVQSGIHVDVVEPSMHNTPLHEAVRNNSIEVVEALLGCGANPSIKNKLGAAPYDMAVNHGFEELITKLSVFVGQTNISKLSKPKKNQSFY